MIKDPERDVSTPEQRAADPQDPEGRLAADVDAGAGAPVAAEDLARAELGAPPPLRHAIAALCPALGAAVVVGGLFDGYVGPRGYAIAVVILAGLLAWSARRLNHPVFTNLAILAGLVVIGLLPAVAVGGPGVVGDLNSLVKHALAERNLVRPPVQLTPGFAAILGWVMAAVGFVSVWTATAIRRPSLGMMMPLAVAGVAAIGLPSDSSDRVLQVGSGMVVVVLFAIGLGVLSGDRESSGEQGLPIGYELRRSLKVLPLLAVVTGALIGVSQTNLLFPHSLINPEEQAQKPKTEPLSSVPDRVLFEVRSTVTGPWVLGTLDVYDGTDWRLPAYAEASLVPLPQSGVVDSSLHPAVRAQFTVRGLGGAILPSLPNTTNIIASGPVLNYDRRSGNIRLVDGEFSNGYQYTVAAAGVPSVQDLEKENGPASGFYARFTQIPPAPPAVRDLLARAPHTSKWAEFDYVRNYVLQTISASGPGTPVSIPVDRVQEILGSSKEASPFELVAIQTMLARWIGIPARIGYGFDGGEKVGDHLEIHPRNGAAFPEVYFSGHGWLPVIGIPQHAKASSTSDPRFEQFLPGVLPSSDIAVPLFVALILPPDVLIYEQIRNAVLLAIGALLVVGLLYALWPLGVKWLARYRRRAAAAAAGPRARIINAYAEWRDALSDYGYQHFTDTPIMLLRRFADDDEHAELAWLVTRVLWGDLQDDQAAADFAADAEELSRVLRRRLGSAHPITVRIVAALSRVSLKHAYAADVAAEGPSRAHAEVARVAV